MFPKSIKKHQKTTKGFSSDVWLLLAVVSAVEDSRFAVHYAQQLQAQLRVFAYAVVFLGLKGALLRWLMILGLLK